MSSNNNPYEYFEYETDPNPEPQPKNGAWGGNSLHDYVDPTLITRTILLLLIVAIFADFLGMIFGFWENVVLRNIHTGAYATDELMQAAAESNDMRVTAVGIFQTLVAIPLGIIFLVWTYRVSKNAHSISSSPLTISPGWAVGWYFIPIANLVMPYNALRQAFLASYQPNDWQMNQSSPLILFWWLIHILAGILGQISFRMALGLNDPTIYQLRTLNGVTLSSDVATVLSNVLTVVIVLRFARWQREVYEQKKGFGDFIEV